MSEPNTLDELRLDAQRQLINVLESQLAVIRQAFPEGHPARTDGDVAEGVRDLVSKVDEFSSAYRRITEDALRALWNDDPSIEYVAGATGPGHVIQHFRQERDQLKGLLLKVDLALDCIPWEVMEHGGEPFTVTLSANAFAGMLDMRKQIAAALAPPVKEMP